MRSTTLAITPLLIVSLCSVGCPSAETAGKKKTEAGPAPVEVAPVEIGPIELRRTYSGTLEATDQHQVAPKVSGRVERLLVDIADPVRRGQLVAELDDAELVQAVTQSEADLAVAKANLGQAKSQLVIAQRELDRITGIHERGVASESDLDVAKANQLDKSAAVEVARARLTRAEALLASAKIRLEYTKVRATWNSGDDERVVAARFVDEGDTVDANQPLVSVIESAPITAAVFVTERDYSRLQVGQKASLTTDAFPGRTFEGEITRISPVFEQTSRQARVELTLPNEDHQLKPGLFVRAEVVLARVEEATLVPYAALVKRGGETGVFLTADGKTVAWRPVSVGIRHRGRVQVSGEGLSGSVVTLGQQLVADGSPITIPDLEGPAK